MKMLGVGLLGISGKYQEQDRTTRALLLSHASELEIDFIDSASVYGLEAHCHLSANQLIGELIAADKLPRAICGRLANKLGAELGHAPADLEALVALHNRSLHELGTARILMVMLHRPSLASIDRDSAFFDYVSKQGSCRYFGISTQCPEVLGAYTKRMRIDIVQVAVNLIDFMRSLPVLTLAKNCGIQVHARSLLASGLLSGKYGLDAAWYFNDSIRARYRQSAQALAIYGQRLSACGAITTYHKELVDRGLYKASLVDFCHKAVLQHPLIDAVIVGGSTCEQLTANVLGIQDELPSEAWMDLYQELLAAWQAPVL